MRKMICLYTLSFLSLFMACNQDANNSTGTTTEISATGNPAIDALSNQIVKTPMNPSLYASRAKAYYEAEGYDEAIADLTKAVSLDTMNIDFRHLLADVYLDYYQSRLALKTMEEAAELYPERIPTLLKLSEFQFILQQHTPSLKTVDQILKLDPQLGDAYYMMGRNFREMGDADRAIASLQKAVDFDPDIIEAWAMLGELFGSRDNAIAVRFYDNALSIDSTYVAAYFGKARYFHNRGEIKNAIKEYENVNRFQPQMVDAYYNSGLAYLELDSLDLAYKKFDLSVKMEPTFHMAYYYRGSIAEMQGNMATAKNDYQQTLNLKSDFTRAQEALDRIAAAK
ncbi:MAG: tetratricopeptide repeat protein [Saprospiraceae bacterium]